MDEKEKILKKLRNMKKYVDFLRSHKSITREGLEEDYELRSAIERNFQLAIESAMDIGEIIISVENLEKPEDYRNILLILGKNKILPKDFAEQFSDAAGFRNILVHGYEDLEKLYNYLQTKLEDFGKFAKFIAKHIEEKEKIKLNHVKNFLKIINYN